MLFVTNMWPDEDRPWYGTFIRTQARSLEDFGMAVDVLYMRGYVDRCAYLRALPAPLVATRRGHYDVVHGHYGHSGAIGRLEYAAPYVMSYCGDDLLGTPKGESGTLTTKTRLEAQVFRRVAYLCDATITKSAEMGRRLPPGSRKRNHVIPNGVDLAEFRPVPRDEARRRLGWGENEHTVLFVGNPGLPRKNYSLASEVCRRLAPDVRDLKLRVAWGIAPADVPIWMSAADALLFPSKWEGSPNSVKEAMAAELPVVATPVGDIAERLRGVPACFVRPFDVAALADALKVAVRYGRVPEAREAVSQLSLDRVARQVNSVYDEAIERKSTLKRLRSRL